MGQAFIFRRTTGWDLCIHAGCLALRSSARNLRACSEADMVGSSTTSRRHALPARFPAIAISRNSEEPQPEISGSIGVFEERSCS